MNKLDMLRFFSSFDSEASESDFTAAELEEALGAKKRNAKEEYFAYYDDVKDRVKGHEDW